MVSRQREFQKKQNAKGLCQKCAAPVVPHKQLCFRHYLFYRLGERGLTKGVLSKVNSNKRELLAAHLTGRFVAITQGFLDPGDKDQRTKDALDIRIRLNIKWGGVRGSRKLAAVMKSMDRLALRVLREQPPVVVPDTQGATDASGQSDPTA